MVLNSIEKVGLYLNAIEGTSGFLCLLDRLFRRNNITRLIRIAGTPIRVRTNSPDVFVAIDSLYHKEYDHIRCANPKTIVDAGANIGTSSIAFAMRFPTAQIFAIEPEARNFEMLVSNTRSFPNIIPIHAAIWGANETRTILDQNSGHWGYTVANTQLASGELNQEVVCMTVGHLLDEYQLDQIDILKVDIEGSEKEVFECPGDWIGQVQVITVELHESIRAGCEDAFFSATRDFSSFERHGEKITAYRM
ncbi:MAG: hypothetical protein CMJ78_27380 [Planctomycetaceae bacterium]|nr:hypothetical protein [Planctomycetaceae bacterium]